ncbi:MAG: ABC transporter substrate-binding protein [Desulfurivibrionaceae bacterium]
MTKKVLPTRQAPKIQFGKAGVILLSAFCFLFIAVQASWAASFTDSSGQSVTVDSPYERIISLYTAHTENLVSLGLDRELIGISTSDDYPPEVLDKPEFSYREDPEKFIAARPDLVLVRPMIERAYPQLLEKLRQVGIDVVSLQPNGVDGVFDYWRKLGILTGREQEASEMISTFKEDLEGLREEIDGIPKEERPRVYFEAMHDKMKTFAPESIAAFVLREAGGINVAKDADQVRSTNIAYYGKEHILSKAREIDVYLAQRGHMNPITREKIMEEPGFSAIKAVRQGRVYIVEEAIVSRPTMRLLEGIKTVRDFIYKNN